MSEFQRYEFMTIDRPLTQEQLNSVKSLSSHIQVSSTHASIDYHWSSFKHDPINILYRFFDGFLYWANWGSPQLAFRFPHGILSKGDIYDYDLEDYLTFTHHPDYDVLEIHFGEMEAPDESTEYELGSLIGIRDELMNGDARSLYIIWLAAQCIIEGYENEVKVEDYEIKVPPVPKGFHNLTAAESALAELLQVPYDLLIAAGNHSKPTQSLCTDDFVTLVKLLPTNQRYDYLIRLAHNEPGLSPLFVRELRKLIPAINNTPVQNDEYITYAILNADSKKISIQRELQIKEQKQSAHLAHLREVYDQQDILWQRAEQEVKIGSGRGYDEALRILMELSEAFDQFDETKKFQECFYIWVRPFIQRPSFVARLQSHKALPDLKNIISV